MVTFFLKALYLIACHYIFYCYSLGRRNFKVTGNTHNIIIINFSQWYHQPCMNYVITITYVCLTALLTALLTFVALLVLLLC